jgi:hypothetical protein
MIKFRAKKETLRADIKFSKEHNTIQQNKLS